MTFKVVYSQSTLGDPALLQQLEQPMAVAKAMAEQLVHRVRDRGQPATPPKPYRRHVVAAERVSSKSGQTYQAGRVQTRSAAGKKTRAGYYVSPAYATKKLGTDKQTKFSDSADFHQKAGVKLGTYDVTGGMWDGLQVRNFGATGAIIDFGGSSLGSSSTRSANTRVVDKTTWVVTVGKNGKPVARRKREVVRNTKRRKVTSYVAGEKVTHYLEPDNSIRRRENPKQVRNWQKAGVVFKHHTVGLLQPTDQELKDVADALMDKMALTTVKLFGGEVVTGSSAHGEMYRRLERALGL